MNAAAHSDGGERRDKVTRRILGAYGRADVWAEREGLALTNDERGSADTACSSTHNLERLCVMAF